MKRVLYGTTALVAASLLVTSVSYAGDEEMMEEEMMAAPISVGVGGYYRVAFGGYSGDGDDGRGHYINQNIEINVAGSTTLDNGITAGVNIWLDAMNGNNSWGDDISETRLYLSGAFGTLTLGSFESAAQLGTVWAPGGNGNFGIKSPFFSGGPRVSWTSAVAGAFEDSFKISYDSPSFNGISLSASYEPDDNQASYTGQRGAEDDGQISEVTSISLGFTQDLMGGSASAGIGVENGTYEVCTANCDASSIRGGLVISIDQVSIGGSILETDNQGASTTDTDVGIGWSQGPLGLGVQYGSRDNSAGGFEVTAINAAYDLGPGVQINSQLAMGSAGNSDFSEFLLGTTISF